MTGSAVTHQSGIENVAAPGQSAPEPQQKGAQDGPEMPVFQFHGFKLRPTRTHDYGLARLWTQLDPDHRHKTLPEFWLTQGATTNSFVLEDAFGPVFFFRMDLEGETICIHIQFPPDDRATRRRLMQGMSIGFAWLEKRLGALGYKTVYFNSSNQTLISFCGKRFGFVWDGRKLVKTLQ